MSPRHVEEAQPLPPSFSSLPLQGLESTLKHKRRIKSGQNLNYSFSLSNVKNEIVKAMQVSMTAQRLCCLLSHQLDTSQSHQGKGHMNWELPL